MPVKCFLRLTFKKIPPNGPHREDNWTLGPAPPLLGQINDFNIGIFIFFFRDERVVSDEQNSVSVFRNTVLGQTSRRFKFGSKAVTSAAKNFKKCWRRTTFPCERDLSAFKIAYFYPA